MTGCGGTPKETPTEMPFRPGPREERGFTLIELLVASTVGLLLVLIVTGILMDAFRFATLLSARVSLNQEGRVAADMLGLGGPQAGINNTPAIQDFTFGLMGRQSTGAGGTGWAPPSGLMALNGTSTPLYRLVLPPDDSAPDPSPTGSLFGPSRPTFTIDCDGADDPVGGCTSAATATLSGRLRSSPGIVSTGRVREITLRFIEPYVLSNRFGSLDDSTITFWTGVLLLVDDHPT